MLHKLQLNKFGKFRRKTLEFGALTVITGANESGKTTVIDSIIEACAGGKALSRISERKTESYGKNRSARAEWRGKEARTLSIMSRAEPDWEKNLYKSKTVAAAENPPDLLLVDGMFCGLGKEPARQMMDTLCGLVKHGGTQVIITATEDGIIRLAERCGARVRRVDLD